MNLDIGLSVAIIIFFIVTSAFFSGAETALTAASRAKLTEMERRGSRRAGMALELLRSRERLAGTLLLGNNISIIGATAVATALLFEHFGGVGVVIAAAIMIAVILIFGEIMPKIYAIAYPDEMALAVAPVAKALVTLFGPIVIGIEYATQSVLKLAGVKVNLSQNALSPHDEIRGAIDLHHREGGFVSTERSMMGGLLDLQDLENFDVMVHRTRMFSIDADEPTDVVVRQLLKSGHSRIPLWKENPDNIVGVIHAKDLFAELQKHGGDASMVKIEDIMSPAWFVPDTRPVSDQLKAFLRRKQHFALVVDEYGEVQGLITLEDIIEEIIGDIKDEHDVSAPGTRKLPDGSFVIDGSVPLRDLNRALGWELPDEEATTLAGLVIHEAREIPIVGQVFNFQGFRFEIMKKRKHQVTQIKVTPEQTG